MRNQHETTITNELVNILRHKRHAWEVETAVHAFIKGNSELDALVIERGREPVGILNTYKRHSDWHKLTVYATKMSTYL